MSKPALVLIVLTTLCPGMALAQETLNKCFDTKGQVTYTNKPCLNAREVQKMEIDPAPIPSQPRAEAVFVRPVTPAPKPAPAKIQLETYRTNGKSAHHSGSKQCDPLSDKLGQILDKMDNARRKGYSQDQMNKWNDETRALESKKQQAGCF